MLQLWPQQASLINCLYCAGAGIMGRAAGRFEFSLPFSTLVSQSPFHPLSGDPFSPSRFPPSALFRFPSFSSPPPCRIGAQRKTHSIARRASSTTFLGFVFGRYLVQKRIFIKIIYINFYRIYLVKVAVCREVPTPPFTSPFCSSSTCGVAFVPPSEPSCV